MLLICRYSPRRRAPLPIESVLQIRGCIPLEDIRTHVSFYKSNPAIAIAIAIAAAYDSDSDPNLFWRDVCWKNGI
ncbi:hypothetical protein OH76DRAFT_1064173 [Lentinus brumalis]|uniref:Uncharacterized protein n=1 Tax=Lentinus brumalis TaxID=2498619 RepID=A0A371DNN0_9APHY|nr:hypothetical protein OH76DRAFT_1064173 [Polyporus brumalis]